MNKLTDGYVLTYVGRWLGGWINRLMDKSTHWLANRRRQTQILIFPVITCFVICLSNQYLVCITNVVRRLAGIFPIFSSSVTAQRDKALVLECTPNISNTSSPQLGNANNKKHSLERKSPETTTNRTEKAVKLSKR